MTVAKPLAALRVAVKDIFQIKGIRTSLCNRAYYELYPPATRTAGCIEILRQSGVKIVGTTKLASFAATEEPIECVDFQAPWNPRADGYQSPAGSSSGSGAAIAAYPWLDIAIGSDSRFCQANDQWSASSRHLSQWKRTAAGSLERLLFNASFSRNTPCRRLYSKLQVRTMMLSSDQRSYLSAHHRQFDVPCFYGRDLEKCRAFANHWYGYELPSIVSVGL